MSLTTDQLKHVAHLARIAIDDEQASGLLDDLNNILSFAAHLDGAALGDLAPMAHPLDVRQPLRPDEVTETNQRERLQRGAPAVEKGLFLVPKVIESA